jgi:hypothetical protein
MHGQARNLPILLKEILSIHHEWPDETLESAKGLIRQLATVVRNIVQDYRFTDNHTARVEYTVILNPQDTLIRLPLDEEDLSPIKAMVSVATADLFYLAQKVEETMVRPLERFVLITEQAKEAGKHRKTKKEKEQGQEDAKRLFHETYDAHTAAALFEASEKLLCFLQVGGQGEGSILKQFDKVEGKEKFIWQVPARWRTAIEPSKKAQTLLEYGLDPRIIPKKTLEEVSGKVKGLSPFEVQRWRKEVRCPECFLWGKSRLQQVLAGLSGVEGQSFIDHNATLTMSTLDGVHQFLNELVHLCLNLYDEEWGAAILEKMQRHDPEFAPPAFVRLPKNESDVNAWSHRTGCKVAMSQDFNQDGFSARGLEITSELQLFNAMFGDISLDSGKNSAPGWDLSPSVKLMLEILYHLRQFENYCPSSLLNGSPGENPFGFYRFQRLLAKGVAMRASKESKPIVWYTQKKHQRKYVGAAIPVNLEGSDFSRTLQAERGRVVGPGPPPSITAPKLSKDNFESLFTTSLLVTASNSSRMSVLDIIFIRVTLNKILEFIYSENRFPTNNTERGTVNQSVKGHQVGSFRLGLLHDSSDKWLNKTKNLQKRYKVFDKMMASVDVGGMIRSVESQNHKHMMSLAVRACTNTGDFEQILSAIDRQGCLEADLLPSTKPWFRLVEDDEDNPTLFTIENSDHWAGLMKECLMDGIFHVFTLNTICELYLKWDRQRKHFATAITPDDKNRIAQAHYLELKRYALFRWNTEAEARKASFVN